MNNNNISLDDWKNLFDIALKFKQTQCWEWMYDIDLFAIQNIDTGEMGYCCIMGNAGQVFGINIYLGDTGLKSYMQNFNDNIDKDDLFYIQNCLALSFEDREMLDKNDLQIIKDLGLKFRGKKQWPQFRCYKPGFYPWYLDREQIKYLTYALEQVIDVALRCKENKELITCQGNKSLLFSRIPQKTQNKLVWQDSCVETQIKMEDPQQYHRFDEMMLKRINKKVKVKRGLWELDFFHAPTLVNDKNIPYYPLIFVIADGEKGLILDVEMTADFEGYIYNFQNKVLNFINTIRNMPRIIAVQREKAYEAVKPLAEQLGIELHFAEELYVVQDFRENFKNFI